MSTTPVWADLVRVKKIHFHLKKGVFQRVRFHRGIFIRYTKFYMKIFTDSKSLSIIIFNSRSQKSWWLGVSSVGKGRGTYPSPIPPEGLKKSYGYPLMIFSDQKFSIFYQNINFSLKLTIFTLFSYVFLTFFFIFLSKKSKNFGWCPP